MQPAESNQLAAVNNRQTLQGTDMDIKELAPALAHRTCNRYKHGDEISHKALDERDHYLRELQASQSREAMLRTYISQGLGNYSLRVAAADLLVEALALPTDDSALMERLREERERVIKVCEQWDVNQHCIDEIRSLT